MRAANQKPLQTRKDTESCTRLPLLRDGYTGEYGVIEAVHQADLDEYGTHKYYIFRYASLRAYLLYS